MRLILLDEGADLFLPLTYLRPVWELRWAHRSLAEAIADALRGNWEVEFWSPRPHIGELLVERGVRLAGPGPGLWLSARFIPEPGFEPTALEEGTLILSPEGEPVGFWGEAEPGTPKELEARAKARLRVAGRLLAGPWELIGHLEEGLTSGLPTGRNIEGKATEGVFLLGEDITLEEGAVLMPGVVVSAERGPVHICRGSRVMPGAYLEGPLYIGPGCLVKPHAHISSSWVGPVTKLGGEVEGSIIQGYSNKQHHGFLGHAYLGEWVNLGSGTEVSDLKNTYGPVKMWQRGKPVDTGMTFLGPVIGDHAKTAIGTRLNTGAVVGIFANVFGEGLPPKFIPSFAWGFPDFGEYSLDRALLVAERVMARRGVRLTRAYRRALEAAFHESRWERA